MVNTNKLKGRIIEKGYSVATLAKAIGVDKSTFYRKLGGECPFTIQDADRIADVLQLTPDEAVAIFFSQIVA